MAKNIRIDGLEWDDITQGVINSIGLNGIDFSVEDVYRIFNNGTVSSFNLLPSGASGTYYWNTSGCGRCANYTNISQWGSDNQPGVYTTRTSISTISGIEGAGGTPASNDSNWHVLSKMGIFIK